MKKPHRRGIALPGRAIVAGLLILLQIAIFAVLGMSLSKWVKIADLVIRVLAFVLVFAIINKRSNPSYKMAWIIFILAAPFVGGVLFFLWGNGKVKPILKKHMAAKHRQSGNGRYNRDPPPQHQVQSILTVHHSGCWIAQGPF